MISDRNASPPCKLCGGRDFRLLFRLSGFDLVVCRSCGLARREPFPNEVEAESLYGEDYFHHRGAGQDGYEDYFRDEALFEIGFSRQLERIERKAAKGNLLEVGCAFGLLVSLAVQRGWDAHGVDVSKYAVEEGSRRYGASLWAGDVHSVGLEEGTLDVMVMNDVLEHLAEPVGDLKACRAKMKKGGLLVLTVPNRDSITEKIFRSNWHPYHHAAHLHHFDRSTIRSALKAAGFEMESVRPAPRVINLDFFNRKSSYIMPRTAWILKRIPMFPAMRRAPFAIFTGEMEVFARAE